MGKNLSYSVKMVNAIVQQETEETAKQSVCISDPRGSLFITALVARRAKAGNLLIYRMTEKSKDYVKR